MIALEAEALLCRQALTYLPRSAFLLVRHSR